MSVPLSLPAVGIFVGGQGRRMGGQAKGLLVHAGQPLIERVPAICREAADGRGLRLYLVGNASAYPPSSLMRVEDRPAGLGPIGGLRALLLEALANGSDALAVAVDLPHLQTGVIRRLYSERPDVPVLAPREADRWQPLLARYRPPVVLPVIDDVLARGQTSLQAIFAALFANGLPAEELVLSVDEQRVLRDWDSPSDMLEKPDAES
jgi:molybdopterin-guanine dinucleotide biosynthesis protein A